MSRLHRICCSVFLLTATLAGCDRNPADGRATGVGGTGTEVTGDPGISTAPGGEGSGPTGTGGQEPADNPAADASPDVANPDK